MAQRMAQPVDAVALHQPHRPGVVVGPHGLAAETLRSGGEFLGDDIERVVPGNLLECRAVPLVADAAQRPAQALGMVLALGVAPDLGADHAGGVAVRRGTADAADRMRVDALDLERAGARAIMRADGG